MYIDKRGNVCSPEYYEAHDFVQGYAFVKSNSSDYYAIIDQNFKVIRTMEKADLSMYSFEGVSDRLVYFHYIIMRTYSPAGDLLYKYAGRFHDGIATYWIPSDKSITGKEEKGYINEKGEIIMKIVESEF